MPAHEFEDIGNVLDYDYYQGTITEITSDDDTCKVDIAGEVVDAVLFYHCTKDSPLRSNGAIEGAAAGFAVGDTVYVMRKNDDSEIKVVAHTDGVRPCGPDLLYIYFTNYCLVWNIKEAKAHDKVILNDSDPKNPTYATFPCLCTDISDWINDCSAPKVAGNMFDYGSGGSSGYPETTPPFTTTSSRGASATEASKPTSMGAPANYHNWTVTKTSNSYYVYEYEGGPYVKWVYDSSLTWERNCGNYGASDGPYAGWTRECTWNSYFENEDLVSPVFFQLIHLYEGAHSASTHMEEYPSGESTRIETLEGGVTESLKYYTPFSTEPFWEGNSIQYTETLTSSDETSIAASSAAGAKCAIYAQKFLVCICFLQFPLNHRVMTWNETEGIWNIVDTVEVAFYAQARTGQCSDTKTANPLNDMEENTELLTAFTALIDAETAKVTGSSSVPRVVGQMYAKFIAYK
jgi:hypothetical protein